jgi:hypothetical protein
MIDLHAIPTDWLLVAIAASWLFIFFLLVGFLVYVLVYPKGRRRFTYPLMPIEEAMRGLTRMVEEAEWLEGERLILAVRHVALAKEAVERAAKACGRTTLGGFHTPTPLATALEEGVEILGGTSSVLTFHCDDCARDMTALVQFPKVGGRPETTDPVTISAPADWRTMGFTASTNCKRCKKLLTKKLLYDALPV